MPEPSFVLYLIAAAYTMGVVWYSLLGRSYNNWMRMAAFPLVGIVAGETLVATGPTYFGLHLYVVLLFTLLGVVADIGFSWIGEQSAVGKIGHLTSKLAQTMIGR